MCAVHTYALSWCVFACWGKAGTYFESFDAGSGAPCTEDADEEVSPLSGEIDLDQGRTPGKHFSFDNLIPAATPDLNLQATPCLRARPTTAPKGEDRTPGKDWALLFQSQVASTRLEMHKDSMTGCVGDVELCCASRAQSCLRGGLASAKTA